FSETISNVSSAFGSFYDMDHPLTFAIIRQPYQSFGGRTRFNFEPAMKTLQTKFTVGGEFLNGLLDSKRFQNLGGTEGDLIFNQELDMTQYSIFAQTETKLSEKTSFEAGFSLNKVEYDVSDLLVPENSGIRDFDLEFSPRFAIVHLFNDAIALRGGVSRGFSPPTANELRDADGSLRTNVNPETGTNYEIGARGNLIGGLNYDLTIFHFRMKNQLIPQTVGLNNTIFVNAGRTNRNGLEAAFSYTWLGDSSSFISRLRPFVNYAFSDFEFRDFRIRNENGVVLNDFTGNDVTGIAPHVVSAGFDIDTNPGIYFNATYFFTDDAPITDDNSVFNPSYQVVNTKIGYRTRLFSSFEADIQFGIDNLFDEKFSSNVSLNAIAFGGGQPAFFNPSLDRNAYVGVGIKYLFN
ncbi:MAG: TonB-dependent receptor domain-containing protein, partial [Balneolaceae bacterium]